MPPSAPSSTKGLFGVFCLSSYLLSVSYGTTFLLAMMLSTFVAVVFPGHLTDLFGTTKAVAGAALLLAMACVGFALVPTFGAAVLGRASEALGYPLESAFPGHSASVTA